MVCPIPVFRTPQTYASNERLASFFDILSTNRDRKGKQFVSTIEAKGHDIYGVQWHPERPQFEWTLHEVRYSCHVETVLATEHYVALMRPEMEHLYH